MPPDRPEPKCYMLVGTNRADQLACQLATTIEFHQWPRHLVDRQKSHR